MVNEGTISTEEAVVVFGLSIGAAGAVAQLIASQRLESIPGGQINFESVLIPSVVASGAIIGASVLVPSETQNVI